MSNFDEIVFLSDAKIVCSYFRAFYDVTINSFSNYIIAQCIRVKNGSVFSQKQKQHSLKFAIVDGVFFAKICN